MYKCAGEMNGRRRGWPDAALDEIRQPPQFLD